MRELSNCCGNNEAIEDHFVATLDTSKSVLLERTLFGIDRAR